MGHGSGPSSRAVCPRVPDAQHWAGRSGGEGPGAGALLAARSIGHGTFRRPGQGQSLGVAAPAAPPRAPRQRAETPPTEARAFLKPRRTPMVPGGARTPQPENHSRRGRQTRPGKPPWAAPPQPGKVPPRSHAQNGPAGPHEQAATALPTLCGLGRGRGATCARPSARTRLHEARHPMLRMPPFETAETIGAAGRRRHGGHGAPPSCAPPSQSLCAWDPHFLCSLQLAGPPGTGLRPAPVGAAPNRECWAQGRAAGQRSSRRGRAGRVLGHTARCPHGMSPALPWKPELDP